MKIDTRSWKEFLIGDYFEPYRGTVKKLQTLKKGDVPVIGAARSNQGVAGYYDVEALYSNKITISCNGVGCGSTFYHNYPFNINGDALVLVEKVEIDEKAKLFLCGVIDKILTSKYSYEEKCSPDKAKLEKILLPADENGDIDWKYMQAYIKEAEKRVKRNIGILKEIVDTSC